MKWNLLFLTLFIGISCCLKSQTNTYLDYKHQKYIQAISSLNRFKLVVNNNDTIGFNKEMNNVQDWYIHLADSLSTTSNFDLFLDFSVKRYINLAYQSNNVNELQEIKDSLLLFLQEYSPQISGSPVISEIYNCFMYASESSSIYGDALDSLVINDIHNWINKIAIAKTNEDSIKSKEIINQFADLYYNRSMVNTAAIIYRHFYAYFQDYKQTYSPVLLTDNYIIYDKNAKSIAKINDDPFWRLLVFNHTNSTFDKTNIINIRRHLFNMNKAIPLIIGRDSSLLDIYSIIEMGKNIDGNLYYLNLNKKDAHSLKTTANFIMLSPDNKVSFYSNSPIEVLDWIENHGPKKSTVVTKNIDQKMEVQTNSNNTVTTINSNSENYSISVQGNWPKNATISVKYYYFTEERQKPNSLNQASLNCIQILHNNNPLFNQNYIHNGKEDKSILINADVNYFIKTSFSDKDNTQFQYYREKIYELLSLITSYKAFVKDYPFRNTEFYTQIESKTKHINSSIDAYISDSIHNTNIKSLIIADLIVYRLKNYLDTDSHKEFNKLMPDENISEIVYNSPFYKQIIDTWINYLIKTSDGESNRLQNGIDYLLGSNVWVPDTAKIMVGQYVWKKMNSIGRDDIMIHIDTSYFAGCGAQNLDIAKRLKGYKRMAIGETAPNIFWKENGVEQQLYYLHADTILIVFWADWCEHCKHILPEIYTYTLSKPGFKVIAVNIDENESSTLIGQKFMPVWNHIQAPEKWNDTIVEQYNIFSTPTIYMLNNKYRIISKNSNNPFLLRQ